MLSEIERHVLDLAVEDSTRLADVVAALRAFSPGIDDVKCLRLAKAMVKRLLKQGYVKLYYDDAGNPEQIHRHVTPLPEEHVRSTFQDDTNWLPELRPLPDLLAVTIGATDEGERALYQ